MDLVDIAYWSVCVVLVGSGVGKLVAPDSFEVATAALGIPTFAGFGRLVGALEIALGLAGVLSGSPVVAGAVGALFVAFAVVVVVAMRAGLDDCGCVGVTRTRPTWTHASVNVICAAVCAGAVAVGPTAIGEGLSSVSALVAVLSVVAVVVLAGLLLTAFSTGSS